MIAFVEDRLPAEAEAVPLARHLLAVALLPEVPADVLESTLLLTTEAVSTALRCTVQPWQLRVEVRPELVRVAVDFTADERAIARSEQHGLQDVLFDALSDDWGMDLLEAEPSTIWFEVGRVPFPV